MKPDYPRYNQGDTNIIRERLSPKNKEILKDFIKKCSITAGEGKLSKIERDILQFFDITELPLDKQTKESVNSFLIVLNKSDRSVWTKNEVKVYLKQFLKWLYKNEELTENIKTENKKGLDNQKITENNLVTEKDIEKMLRFAENYKEKAYLFLAFESGGRPQELLNLKWKNIIFEDNYADVNLYSNKTEEARTFPVHKAREHLWNWKQNYSYPNVSPNDYVFCSRWREKPLTSAGVNKFLRRMSERAGLNKDVWGYLFRHTRATRLYEELPQQIVEKLMGHKNMAGIYAHISSKKAREEMLSKIYNIEELTPQDNDKIEKLTEEIQILNNKFLEESSGRNALQDQFSKFLLGFDFMFELSGSHKEMEKKYGKDKVQEVEQYFKDLLKNKVDFTYHNKLGNKSLKIKQ